MKTQTKIMSLILFTFIYAVMVIMLPNKNLQFKYEESTIVEKEAVIVEKEDLTEKNVLEGGVKQEALEEEIGNVESNDDSLETVYNLNEISIAREYISDGVNPIEEESRAGWQKGRDEIIAARKHEEELYASAYKVEVGEILNELKMKDKMILFNASKSLSQENYDEVVKGLFYPNKEKGVVNAILVLQENLPQNEFESVEKVCAKYINIEQLEEIFKYKNEK